MLLGFNTVLVCLTVKLHISRKALIHGFRSSSHLQTCGKVKDMMKSIKPPLTLDAWQKGKNTHLVNEILSEPGFWPSCWLRTISTDSIRPVICTSTVIMNILFLWIRFKLDSIQFPPLRHEEWKHLVLNQTQVFSKECVKRKNKSLQNVFLKFLTGTIIWSQKLRSSSSCSRHFSQ